MKRRLATRLLGRTGLRALISRVASWSGILALNYHRIGDPKDSPFDRGLWSATPDGFREQVRFCKANLDVIRTDDLADAVTRGRGRYAIVTFDDGYRDNYEVAFSILRAERVPATFFVTTGFLDSAIVPWWDEIAWMVRTSRHHRIELNNWLPGAILLDEPDRERAVRTLLRAYKSTPTDSTARFLDAIGDATGTGRYPRADTSLWMTWDMIREMRAAGMTIGGHTMTHPVLARATRERQASEILGCSYRLAEELREPMAYFSYPVGGRDAFDEVTRDCLREAGVHYAFSYYGGFRRFADWDDLDVRRVAVERYLTRDWFRAIVSLPWAFA